MRKVLHDENCAARLSRLPGGIAAVASYMRTLLATCAASLLATDLLVSSALGDKPIDQHSNDKHSDERTVFVTGSLIPQRIKRKPIGTTTVSPVRIIDRHEIDATGRRTTRGILVVDPSLSATGR